MPEDVKPPKPQSFRDFQREVRAWARETLPASEGHVAMRHLFSEYLELSAALEGKKSTPAEEAADMLLILCSLAEDHGFNLISEARKKLSALRQRDRWQFSEDLGHYVHVDEIAAPEKPGAPMGGTFTVVSGEKTSQPLPHDATATEVDAAIADLQAAEASGAVGFRVPGAFASAPPADVPDHRQEAEEAGQKRLGF